MAAEIGPPISRISQSEQKGENDPQITQNEKDKKTLYRGRYVEPDKISSDEGNTSYKVIYCVASLK